MIIRPLNIEGLRKLFELFYETYQERSDLKGLRIKALVYETIYTLIKYFSTQKQNTGDMNEITLDRLTKITMYIDENYMQQLSLKIVAVEIGITAEHLSRFFKKHMDISFVTYIDMVRLNHASSMLMNTNRSIAYISDVCGFSTYRIFTNKFKKYYHTPPRKFRLLYKETMAHLKNEEMPPT